MSLFIRSKEAAEILGIKPSTLAEWRAKGWVPYYRRGGHPVTGRGGSVYYRRREVEECITRFRVQHVDACDFLKVVGE